MRKRNGSKKVALLTMLLAVALNRPAKAAAPSELAIPSCETTLSLCLEYRAAADREILNLKAQVQGQKAYGELAEGQRDRAYSLGESSMSPALPWIVPAAGGAAVTVGIYFLVKLIAGGLAK